MRQTWTRAFLWIAVIAWGMLLGAKLFDLQVLVGAWSASPPESLRLLPYGPNYPVDTGEFFIPSSAALLVSTLGALIAGWRTPNHYRILLIVSLAMIFATLILTVLTFWPRNAALWAVAQGRPNAVQDPAAIVHMVRQWVMLDWVRIALGTTGFLASIRAISIPFPVLAEEMKPASLPMKTAYGIGIAIVVAFVIYFAGNV
ncbi:MAG: DUF1772 domain-containing protein [Proteobacteria bacterium]|nr:DUF1772 domain-containing protein [Pseudomonadota bacterium]